MRLLDYQDSFKQEIAGWDSKDSQIKEVYILDY